METKDKAEQILNYFMNKFDLHIGVQISNEDYDNIVKVTGEIIDEK